MNFDPTQFEKIIPALIDWHRRNRRPMPWRDAPTPYHVWLSEIMLQQTRIEAATPYYLHFIAELPDIASLAAADDDRLMKLWEGLGYYSRVRNLKKAAGQVMEQYAGRLPDTVSELRGLPGIGDYTAGAIASIAYGRPEPAVDGNVLRVLMRLTLSDDDVLEQRTKKEAAAHLRSVYPSGEEAGLLSEALMELGEVVCIPSGAPRCGPCPVCSFCAAEKAGRAAEYPVRSAQKARRVERRTVVLLRCGGRYAVQRRPQRGLLAGLWEFPNFEGVLTDVELAEKLRAGGVEPQTIEPCGDSRHIFTHVEWLMTGRTVWCGGQTGGYRWKTAGEIRRELALPSAFAAYTAQLRDD